MAIPGSGAIAASAINTELGRSSTATISLTDAPTGVYVAINTDSVSRPNASTPHGMGEWYSYDHTYVPPTPTVTISALSYDASTNNFSISWSHTNLPGGGYFEVDFTDLYVNTTTQTIGSATSATVFGIGVHAMELLNFGDPNYTANTLSISVIMRNSSTAQVAIDSDTLGFYYDNTI